MRISRPLDVRSQVVQNPPLRPIAHAQDAMAVTGLRGDGAERSLKPGSGHPDLLAKRDGLAVARPADVGRFPDIRTAELVGVADVADAVV